MNHPITSGGRRGLAASLSGVLVAGTVAGTVVGGAAPASAEEVDVEHEFVAVCNVQVDDLNLGNHDIKFDLASKAEVPLVPGGRQPKKQGVAITLTMPEGLQKATKVLDVTHARGHSPDSAVAIKAPISPKVTNLGKTHTQRIPLQNLRAAKSPVPKVGTPWKITSNGTVPRFRIPGFYGSGSSAEASLRLPPKFTIRSTLFSPDRNFKSTMKCTVKKGQRVINPAVPLVGPYKTDTLRTWAKMKARGKRTIRLNLFNAGENPANKLTKPKHGFVKWKNKAKGTVTYKPRRNFTGKDTFNVTAKDDNGKSSSKVVVRVTKRNTRLGVKAPKAIRFGKRAIVRVTVKSLAAKNGKVRITKGKRVLAKGKAKAGGKAKLRIKPKKLKVGKHTLRVKYAGNPTSKKKTRKFTLRVKKRR